MRGSRFRIGSSWSEAKDLASARVPFTLLLTAAGSFIPLHCIQDDGVPDRGIFTTRNRINPVAGPCTFFPEYLNDLASIPHS